MIAITTKVCPGCGRQDTYMVSEQGAAAYQAGEHIQVALPELNADQREQFISGECKTCWDQLMGKEEA